MEHFASEDWLDFARNVGAAERHQPIEAHLASGCEECQADLRFWKETLAIASREAAYEPPANILRYVKAVGSMHLAQAERPRFVLAELVLDSSLAPAAAGVRSSGVAPAMLLYKFGSVNIDLRIEQVPASKRISIVGQVMDSSRPGNMNAKVQVAAMFDDLDVHKTATNNFGEFQLELEPASEMYLAVHIDKRMEIWVPLNQSKGEYPQSAWS